MLLEWPGRLLAALVLLACAGACASLNEAQCRGADWQAIGLQDGRSGQPVSRLDDHRKACGKYGIVPDDKLWLATREQGLKQYCTPIHGLKLGRSGFGYTGACPADSAAGFLSAYWVGQAAARARVRVSDLESQLYALQNRLAKVGPGKEREHLLREEAWLGGRWGWPGGELSRARHDLWQAERRADELAHRLDEAASSGNAVKEPIK